MKKKNKNTNEEVKKPVAEETEVVETEVVEPEIVEKVEPEVVNDKASEYLERLQRLMAEFDNYRKRTEKEKTNRYEVGASDTIKELLPIIDNFERALVQESTDEKLVAGVNMIYKQLIGVLEKIGVKTIEAKGQEFNPDLHSAIGQIDSEDVESNHVAVEHQKGYIYKDKVIRHSMVTVAN